MVKLINKRMNEFKWINKKMVELKIPETYCQKFSIEFSIAVNYINKNYVIYNIYLQQRNFRTKNIFCLHVYLRKNNH